MSTPVVHCCARTAHDEHTWHLTGPISGRTRLCICPGTSRREAKVHLKIWRDDDPRKDVPKQ